MPRFQVHLCTEVWEYRTYEVEAPDEDAAIEVALEQHEDDPVEADNIEVASTVEVGCKEVKTTP